VPPAFRVAREIGVLTAAGTGTSGAVPARVIASRTDPVLLITRRVAGAPLFEVIGSIDRDRPAGS